MDLPPPYGWLYGDTRYSKLPTAASGPSSQPPADGHTDAKTSATTPATNDDAPECADRDSLHAERSLRFARLTEIIFHHERARAASAARSLTMLLVYAAASWAIAAVCVLILLLPGLATERVNDLRGVFLRAAVYGP